MKLSGVPWRALLKCFLCLYVFRPVSSSTSKCRTTSNMFEHAGIWGQCRNHVFRLANLLPVRDNGIMRYSFFAGTCTACSPFRR